ncbi:MAG TPA: VWA domain-containing protein [Candidatus Acidoferrales bacterium]|nr:VWA domain-containing protein [Candidatus Acidoferrales bacterium]
MLRINKRDLWIFSLLLAMSITVWAQYPASQSAPPQSSTQSGRQPLPGEGSATPQQPQATQPSPNYPSTQQPAPSAGQEQTPPANAPNQPGDSVKVPANAGAAPDTGQLEQDAGGFRIRKEVREVTLHATVVDDKQHLVTDLDRNAFTVYEDGAPQRITSFRHEDIPVAVGIVIDNSGSMRQKRPAVNQAALNFVRASNPQDEVFVVNFNQDYYLDQDYTGNVNLLRDALERIESRGETALYDACVASADHLMKSARLQKKVLLVITDGEDNASVNSSTVEQAIRKIAVDGGPTVYTIGLLGDDKEGKRAKRALRMLAEATGGVSFFPRDLNEVDTITKQVAHDIRNQYTIGYKPATQVAGNGYRTVKVEAKAPGYKRLQVRTRSGYYAGTQTSASK